MSGNGSTPLDRVPTLTEVVVWPKPESAPSPEVASSAPPMNAPEEFEVAYVEDDVPQLTEAELTQQVLANVERQINLMLEYRLREALMPALVRATDSLVREARGEMASTMRDVVALAVAQEMARHRNR